MHTRPKSQVILPLLLGALFCSGVVTASSSVFAAGESNTQPHPESHGDSSHDTSVPLEPKVDLVLISIISFGLFLIVLRKVAWGPLIAGLDGRESSYRKLLADAQQDRDKAIAILGDYETKLKAAQAEVDEIIAEARRDAERTKTDIIAAAQTEAETTRNRALDDIGRARDQAVAELFDHMRSNVVAATEQVLSRSLNDEDHQRLVDEALAQVSGS
ncbi:MAG: F0F1 ATP synthase subunit B [Planctomycetaceae bacterium]